MLILLVCKITSSKVLDSFSRNLVRVLLITTVFKDDMHWLGVRRQSVVKVCGPVENCHQHCNSFYVAIKSVHNRNVDTAHGVASIVGVPAVGETQDVSKEASGQVWMGNPAFSGYIHSANGDFASVSGETEVWSVIWIGSNIVVYQVTRLWENRR